MRKLVINLLLIFIVIMMMSVSVCAEEDNMKYSFGHFYYHSHEGYVSVCGYLGRETDIEIPSSIAGKPVSEIEAGTFDGCNTVKTITVPDTVVMLYNDSFTGATALEKIITYTVGVEINAGSGVLIDYVNDTTDDKTEEHAPKNTGTTDEKKEDTKPAEDKDKTEDNKTENNTLDDSNPEDYPIPEDTKEKDPDTDLGDYVYEDKDESLSDTDEIRIDDTDIPAAVEEDDHLNQINIDSDTVIVDAPKERRMEKQLYGLTAVGIVFLITFAVIVWKKRNAGK